MAIRYGDIFNGSFAPAAAFPTAEQGGLALQRNQRTPSSAYKLTEPVEVGRPDFEAALIDWNRVYSDATQGIPSALALIEQFAPGGEFGAGRRREATELIQQGVAKDSATAVALGASSTFANRGLNVLAGSELATQFANIEDTRAQLQTQAFAPYTAMLANLARVGIERPTRSQFIDIIEAPTTRQGTKLDRALAR